MTTTRSTVRIFISSPGDVNDERDKARRVIDDLQRHYAGATLQPVLWEDFALPATASFQETIDFILETKPIDVAVFVLWSRLGSPLGPAITRPNGTPYRSGTEREFDLMLAAFAQSGRQRPVILAYARDDEGGFRQSLAECPAARLEELIAQRRLAESFIREQFKDAEGHNLRAYHSYREPLSFAQRLHTHLRQVLDELLGADFAPRWTEEPYRGLEFFDISHADIFHGREEETCDLLQRLRDQEQAGCAFAVIVGASGSGKSSLARAGVADFLTRHSFEDGVKEWRAVVFVPSLSANDLCIGLIRSLAEQIPDLCSSANALDDLAGGLAKDPALTVKLSIVPAFTRAAEKGSGAVRVLLILDQMEEFWTDRRITAEDRERFLMAIEALACSGLISVLATLRSDFYPHAQRSATFLRLKRERGHYDLLPPGPAALQRLIAEPARLAGLRFERDERTEKTLDEVILEDASRDPAALPLLQYALSELYRRRDEIARTLTFAEYEKLGGVEGALGRRAADTFNGLSEEARAALPDILPLLVTVDVAGEQAAVRRRAPLADLTATPARRALTESLIAARFLTTDRQDDVAVVGLAHEALLRRWEQLADWVTANREHLRLRARVEQNRQRWEQQRDPSLLLTPGLPLEEGRQLLSDAPALLSTETADYIRVSITQYDFEQTRNRRRRRAVLATMSVLTVLALAGAIGAWFQRNEKAQLASMEKTARETADANSQTARVEADRARRHLYVVQMNSAQVAWEQAHVGRVRDLLNKSLPKPDGEDLRDFEWYYWNRLCHSYLFVLRGHTGPVYGVTFSPDGKRLASASHDQTVRLWDATGDGHELSALKTLKGHTLPVTSVAFSPDGKRLASASHDQTVRLWDATRDGQELLTLNGHTNAVWSVAFITDGKRLVSEGWKKPEYNSIPRTEVKLWNATSGQEEIGSLIGIAPGGTKVVYSADGKLLASAGDDRTVKVWDVISGQERLTLKGHAHNILNLAFSTDGKRLASASYDKTVKLWDLSSGKDLHTLVGHTLPVTSVAFSADGKRLASASYDQTVKTWDVTTGQQTLTLIGHAGHVNRVAFSADGKRLASAGDDQTVMVWDALRGQFTIALEGPANSIWGVAFSPDGRRIATANYDGTTKIWDAITGQETLTLKGHLQLVTSVAFSPDGKRLASASHDETVKVWDITNGQDLLTLRGHTDDVTCVAFSPDGKRLATASHDRTVKVWDATSGQTVHNLQGHTDSVRSVAFSVDGDRLASASWDHSVKLWNSTSGQATFTLRGHTDLVMSVVFDKDGQRLFSCSKDRSVKMWDVTNGQEIITLNGHNDAVMTVALNSDGTRLASGGGDRAVKLWDIKSGQETLTLQGHTEAVSCVAFSADGKRLATASHDGTVKVWDARPWTQELRAEREALSVIRFLRDQGKVQAEWPDAIMADPTISELVRERALQFAHEWK